VRTLGLLQTVARGGARSVAGTWASAKLADPWRSRLASGADHGWLTALLRSPTADVVAAAALLLCVIVIERDATRRDEN
jgi:hypothetical protein